MFDKLDSRLGQMVKEACFGRLKSTFVQNINTRLHHFLQFFVKLRNNSKCHARIDQLAITKTAGQMLTIIYQGDAQ